MLLRLARKFPEYHRVREQDDEDRDKIHGAQREDIVKNLLLMTGEEADAHTLLECCVDRVAFDTEYETL